MPDPLQAFHDVRFPLAVAFGATGGPERRTEIVALGSGHERRTQRWSRARRRYDAGAGLRSLDDLHAVTAFFEARRGPLHSFRYHDPIDGRSGAPLAEPVATDQRLGEGDGATATFQLAKRYGDGPDAEVRAITRPVEGSVIVAVDGAEVEASVDHATGLVTLADPPPAGATVTAGFLFDVPVRFETDRLVVALAAFSAGEVPSIPLVEVIE